MSTPTCTIIKNRTDFYARRNRVAKKKYGDSYKENSRFFMICDEERCVNPDHMYLQETIFSEYGKKPCSNCKRWLPKNAFYEDQKAPSKTTAKCKTCFNLKTAVEISA